MFIEFQLLDRPGDPLHQIKKDIAQWADQQQIKYTQKTTKHAHRLAFDDDRHYSVFVLTWNSKMEYQLIDRQW